MACCWQGPELYVGEWLTNGAPAGILHQPLDAGIFPDCPAPADNRPEDIQCDEKSFRDYPGVEEQYITETELLRHLAKGHLAAFDTYAELEAFVGGKPVLNKLGLIVKTRNGVTKARMILDTKGSGVKLDYGENSSE